ncbi:Protein asteroid -like protein 1 [Halotydeus destructor]|nr:Protein asteroid -like protein 1 [Halotydeus destructor]
MGVRGLKTLIDNNSDLMKRRQLHDTQLVIDGSAVMYYMYSISSTTKMDFRYGGDYILYADKVKQFFSNLSECNIEPIVVLDGGSDPSNAKLKTTMTRLKSRLSSIKTIMYKQVNNEVIMPILARTVFCDVLKDLNIKRVVSLYEADADVAQLANHFQCPVLSNDSDFFVYDLSHGYIPLPTFDCRHVRTDGDNSELKYIDCLHYEVSNLLNRFPELDRSLLPLFSTIMGNDYVDQSQFQTVFGNIGRCSSDSNIKKVKAVSPRHRNMVYVLNWLKGKTSEEANDQLMTSMKKCYREKASQLVQLVEETYRAERSNLNCLVAHVNGTSCVLDHSLRLEIEDDITEVPDWLVRKLISGTMDSQLLDVLVTKRIFMKPQPEDFTLVTSYECARRLQGYVFALLRNSDENEIVVYDRTLGAIVKFHVPKLDTVEHMLVPPFSELPKLSDQFRMELMKTMLQCESRLNISKLLQDNSLPETVSNQIEVIVQLIQYSASQPESVVCLEFLLAAILLVAYYLIAPNMAENKSDKNSQHLLPRLERFKSVPHHSHAQLYQPRKMHYIAQLEAVILLFNQLNALLSQPMPDIRVDTWFDGVFLYHLTSELCDRKDPLLYCSELVGRGSKMDELTTDLFSTLPLITSTSRYRENNSRKVMRVRKNRHKRNVLSGSEL